MIYRDYEHFVIFFIFLKKKAKKETIYIVGGIFYGRYN